MDDTRGFAWCDVLVRTRWIVPGAGVGSRPHLPILSPTRTVLHIDPMGWNRRWTVHRKTKQPRGVRIDLFPTRSIQKCLVSLLLSIMDGFIDDPPVHGWVRRFASLGSEWTAPGATKTRKMEFDHSKENRTNHPTEQVGQHQFDLRSNGTKHRLQTMERKGTSTGNERCATYPLATTIHRK